MMKYVLYLDRYKTSHTEGYSMTFMHCYIASWVYVLKLGAHNMVFSMSWAVKVIMARTALYVWIKLAGKLAGLCYYPNVVTYSIVFSSFC